MLETGQDFSYEYERDEIERLKNAQLKNINKKIKQLNITKEELNFA
jgi:hypothetical protein